MSLIHKLFDVRKADPISSGEYVGQEPNRVFARIKSHTFYCDPEEWENSLVAVTLEMSRPRVLEARDTKEFVELMKFAADHTDATQFTFLTGWPRGSEKSSDTEDALFTPCLPIGHCYVLPQPGENLGVCLIQREWVRMDKTEEKRAYWFGKMALVVTGEYSLIIPKFPIDSPDFKLF